MNTPGRYSTLTFDRQLTDIPPTVDRYITNSWPIHHRDMTDSPPIYRPLYRSGVPTVIRKLSSISLPNLELWPSFLFHDKIWHSTHRVQHVNTFTLIGSQLVIMVLRAQWPLGTIAQFFHFVVEEKKQTTKKQRRFMTGLPQVYQ